MPREPLLDARSAEAVEAVEEGQRLIEDVGAYLRTLLAHVPCLSCQAALQSKTARSPDPAVPHALLVLLPPYRTLRSTSIMHELWRRVFC